MIREITPDAQGNYAGNKRPIYRSDNELKMREAVEAWGRPRWPNARVVHELVMGRGAVRADVAFITPNHIAVVEIKSDRDDTDRLLHQAGMFRAAVPELWIASLHSAACCSDSSSARFTSCRIASVREFPDDALPWKEITVRGRATPIVVRTSVKAINGLQQTPRIFQHPQARVRHRSPTAPSERKDQVTIRFGPHFLRWHPSWTGKARAYR
jgi:hypothetical protein